MMWQLIVGFHDESKFSMDAHGAETNAHFEVLVAIAVAVAAVAVTVVVFVFVVVATIMIL